ncbi:ABC transporter permease [Dyella sp.]|jgi:ABC-2 type transport system permease protein|uniref:ABC transporter permease n=1 Tax=Dyella sp. TaxID=1869338 RepID=UPI002D78D78C|nr:ABC transporter permease [Dyella sp.]HET6432563.1 ABC transporter permease [Dyella sp.]
MPSVWTCLYVEYRKHARSLALLLAVVAPLLIAVFVFFNLVCDHRPISWDMTMATAAAIWAYFMLPMSVTALTALVAQAEHGPRAWDQLHALPLPRARLYAAKALWVLIVVALMSAAVGVASWLAVHAASAWRPDAAPTGRFDAVHYLGLITRIYLSAWLLVAVQTWIALRFHSFVPALAAGIGGTFFAVVASSARVGVVLPWQIPVNMLASDPARMHLALGVGLIGGVAVMALMVRQLARREVI